MTKFKEIWTPVNHPDYKTAYEVSSYGRIRSIPRIANSEVHIRHIRGVILKGRTRQDGHRTVNLSFGRKRQCFYVRQLVADAFIPNPDNLPVIINKNGIFSDCSRDNLQRLSSEENIAHTACTVRHPAQGEKNSAYTGPIYATCIQTGERKEYHGKKSLRVAGFDPAAVYACLSGRQKSHKGKTFSRERGSC